MASSEDTEITLGTGKLLVVFFGLVAICALFFALGYSLGRKSEPALAAGPMPGSQLLTGGRNSSSSAAPPMTFYKNVEQKNANAQLTPAADAETANGPGAKTGASTDSAGSNPAQTPASNAADPATVLPTSGYFVQVAAVTKQEDADALVDALKKKEYPAFVAQPTADKLFRVQVGPYSDVKDAEAMRTRLISDGYSPIVKK